MSRGEESARGALDRGTVEAVVDLALGQASPDDQAAADEFVVRFQQTCGPAMAKAIEDTAYYRYVRLVGLNEVGGDPDPGGRADPGVPRVRAGPAGRVAAVDDDALDPRHQARGGRPGAALRPRRATRRVGVLGAHGPRARCTGASRGARRAHRVLPVADPRRRVADQRGPPAGLRPQGDPGVEALHAVDRARRGLRVGRRALRLRSRDDARDRGSCRVLGRVDETRDAGERARSEARPADDAGRARRLPGHRPRRPLPRRPGQPPRGRLRGASRSPRPSRRWCRPGRPRTTRSCS